MERMLLEVSIGTRKPFRTLDYSVYRGIQNFFQEIYHLKAFVTLIFPINMILVPLDEK